MVSSVTAKQSRERARKQEAKNRAALEGGIKLAQAQFDAKEAGALVQVEVRRPAAVIQPGGRGSKRDEIRDCPYCNLQSYSDCVACSVVECDCCRHKWCDRCCAPMVTKSLIDE